LSFYNSPNIFGKVKELGTATMHPGVCVDVSKIGPDFNSDDFKADHIEDTQRLVTEEIEMRQVVLYLVSRRSNKDSVLFKHVTLLLRKGLRL
jgi:hypothetical protein